MAFFNEIGAGRYNRLFQKLLNMKGGPPARQMASEVSFVFPLMHGRENRILEDWRTFGGRVAITAVAAVDSVARINNPIKSNIVAVLESMTLLANANMEYFVEFSNTDSGVLASTFTPAAFDNRQKPPGSGSNGAACIISGTTNIGQGTHFLCYDSSTGASGPSVDIIQYEAQEIQLLPGSDLQVRTAIVNVNLTVNFRWRERTLEESEVTFA